MDVPVPYGIGNTVVKSTIFEANHLLPAASCHGSPKSALCLQHSETLAVSRGFYLAGIMRA